MPIIGCLNRSCMPRMNVDLIPRHDETLDRLACGDLCIFQKQRGYRFSLDAYLLAAFVDENPGARALEIGSGSGVVSILLAALKNLLVTGVEVQKELAGMSQRSVAFNQLQEQVQIVHADIKSFPGEKYNAVVTNPPFRPAVTGRINPDSEKALSRHEILLDLDTLIRCGYKLLSNGGRFYIIYTAWRMVDLICAMRRHRIEPKKIMMVHSSMKSRAERCLVCGIKDGGKELLITKPLFIYDTDGYSYTLEMQSVFQKMSIPKSH